MGYVCGRMRLPFFYGWAIVAVAFVTMALGVNARTAFSLLFPPILGETGWARAETAGAFSFGFVVTALLSPLLGRLMDRLYDTIPAGVGAGPFDPEGSAGPGSASCRADVSNVGVRPALGQVRVAAEFRGELGAPEPGLRLPLDALALAIGPVVARGASREHRGGALPTLRGGAGASPGPLAYLVNAPAPTAWRSARRGHSRTYDTSAR